MNKMKRPLGVYVHWPFCKSKCPYCDFNSHVREQIDVSAWKNAYLTELRSYKALLKDEPFEVRSIFFGGGTPSLMPVDLVASVIDEIQKLWPTSKSLEITLEANPTSVEIEKFKGLAKAGVNRVSIGVQSFRQEDLTFLGREHSADEAKRAIEAAKSCFGRFSFDLIYARPNQTLESWRAELEEALTFDPSHISLYQLTIEKGTAFYTAYQQNKFELPSPDLSADLYDMTGAILGQRGLSRYEVSNYARAGHESQHNLIYWRYQDYIGIGPGAHGRCLFQGERRAIQNHRAPEIYLERVAAQKTGMTKETILTHDEVYLEMMMMGLRLAEGIELSRIKELTGKGLHEWTSEPRLAALIEGGFLRRTEARLIPTDQGLLLLNQVLERLTQV